MTGYQATIGILAAIAARAQSGRGQHVEVDMFSVVLDAQLQELVTFMNSGHDPKRSEEWSAHAAIPAPYGVYKTADGWLTLAMAPLPQLGEVLNDGWLRSLTDYNDGRVHRDSVFAHIRNAFLRRTTSEWIERCDECGVWAGPVYNYQDVVKDPHLISTGGFVSQPTGIPGKEIITVRPPIRMSDSDVGVRLGAPLLGEHSNEILVELGYSANEIERLTKVGAVSVRG
jgi:crotonobetainyl-CoA:carnitine CoA-transferase CaiB-like acyl-CoA transferase